MSIARLAVSLALIACATLARAEVVNVGGRQVEESLQGTGTPTVVFESGFTGGQLLWLRTQATVAKETRTLVYERAGLGRSEPVSQPRTAEQIAHELHALLAAQQLAPPYVLVGHSAGGLYARVFAHMYPQEVVGLVLVDPATEDYYERLRTVTADQWAAAPATMEKGGAGPGAVGQWLALPESLAQAQRAWPLPAVPCVVLTSTQPLNAWPLATAEDMEVWGKSHAALAARIPGARHVVLDKTNHLTILSQPALIDEIVGMVKSVRAK